MKGSHSVDIANLLFVGELFSEPVGKLGLTAGVAGNFSIQLNPSDADLTSIHVSVHKKRSSQFTFG